MARVAGIVLAAGQGSRMGQPKALLRTTQGLSYLSAAVGVLAEAGCAPVVAVLGAQAETAARTLTDWAGPSDIHIVHNENWHAGMSTSLRIGLETVVDLANELAELELRQIDAVLIHLVDLPDVGARVVQRIIAATDQASSGQLPVKVRGALVRAVYAGKPGHPVLIGADHWGGVLDSLRGDAGARGYLREHATTLVDVSDLATGVDVDTPEERLRFEAEHPA